MIKVLWNRCEVDQTGGPVVIGLGENAQCPNEGEERAFTDEYKAVMCAWHWNKCIGVSDEQGKRHTKLVADGGPR